jgi:hypothetical protein
MEHGRAAGPGRWFRTGRSVAVDAATAGAQAAAEALAGRSASLLLVFCSARYDVAALLAGVCSAAPDDLPIVGGTTNGEICTGGNGRPALAAGPGVVVMALGGPGFTANPVLVEAASTRRRDAGIAAAAAMEPITAPFRVLMMIADGLTREQHELVRGAYSVLGMEVPIVGGCTGDDLDYAVTHQFLGTGAGVRAYTDALVAVGLGSTGPIGIGLAHGWAKRGDPMVVTSSEVGEVFLLDDEPALEVYLRRVGETRALLDDPQRFREVAFQNPLGMSRRTGEDIRVIHAADPEHDSLLCLADVPQGALVWTMTTDAGALVRAAGESCARAVEGLAGTPPQGLLVFDCGARRLKLGEEQLLVEQDAMADQAQGAAIGGFYTYGEIGRTQGSRGMHHLTVVTLALG